MEPKTLEHLEQVRILASTIGFDTYIRPSGEYATFTVRLPSGEIGVFYEFGNPIKDQASVSVGWSSCDGGQVSTAQAQDFMKFMGYALLIAEKLKE